MRYDFKIENVVSTAKLSDHFDLIDIESKLEGAEYNKTKFPGLVYRIKEPKSVFLLFNSGKVVCTGCKSIDDAKNALINVKDTLINLSLLSHP